MKAYEIKKLINTEPYLTRLGELYPSVDAAITRIVGLVDLFELKYGKDRDIIVVSAPGRSEICGNHTDHNSGVVIGASINKDILAVASPRSDGLIRVQSVRRREDVLTLSRCESPENFSGSHSDSLIGGVVGGFIKAGYDVGGFDCYTTSDVLAGSGLSSSAAFEGVIGTVINHLYCGGSVTPEDIAKIGQYAENVYYGKPSGLLDQMACAIGGYVYMDFEDKASPRLMPIDFRPERAGYSLVIVATGGSHADLGEDYAAIPGEMKAVAASLGATTLREVDRESVMANIRLIRERHGDRALLRALHFFSECERVESMREALVSGDIERVLDIMRESGHSSFEFLQNVYTNKKLDEQGLSLALMLTEGFTSRWGGASRVHGGGFAGTIQALIRTERAGDYCRLMDGVFGKGASMVLSIRQTGLTRII